MKRLLILCSLVFGCGSPDESSLKIVGGHQASHEPFYGKFEVGGGFRCGSSLIKKRWVITAKHCLPSNENHIKVRLGAWKMQAGNGGKPFELIAVKKVVAHPTYDLALLKLKRPSSFNPVRIYSGNNIPDRYLLKAIGFGSLGKGMGSPSQLQQVTLYNIANAGIWHKKPHLIYVGAGVGKDVCHGDSGGPLIYKGKLVGVAFWTGSQCGQHDSIKRPSAYTKIDMPWLNRVVGN